MAGNCGGNEDPNYDGGLLGPGWNNNSQEEGELIETPGHDYTVGPHPVCLDAFWINCTDDEVEDYLSRFQFPGQLFWQPIAPYQEYNVFPEMLGGYKTPIGYSWPGSGHIWVDKNGNVVTNVAYPEHIFDGVVDRISTRDANGNPQITTHGYGINSGFQVTNNFTISGEFIDGANNYVGGFAFDRIDRALLLYTTTVETWQYITGTQQFP